MSGWLNTFLQDIGPIFYLLVALNVLLIILAPRIIDAVTLSDIAPNRREFFINVLRGLNVLVIALLGHFRFYSEGQSGQGFGIKILSILIVLYLSYLAAHLAGRFVTQRYGRKIQVSGSERIADTYASRGLSISISVFIGIIALISIVRIAGFSSLLETGGVIGFIGVFLALTQGAWAPDIISGLIILNTNMIREREVVRLDTPDGELLAIVFRTKAFHTELRDLVDNHRIMIKNSKIRDYTLHNLSRYASAKGLRETLHFKIGYDVSPDSVHKLFEKSYEIACEDDSIEIESQHPLEIRVQDTGDHAVAWSIHYYTQKEESLLKTRQLFLEVILHTAMQEGIALSTPITHSAV